MEGRREGRGRERGEGEREGENILIVMSFLDNAMTVLLTSMKPVCTSPSWKAG